LSFEHTAPRADVTRIAFGLAGTLADAGESMGNEPRNKVSPGEPKSPDA